MTFSKKSFLVLAALSASQIGAQGADLGPLKGLRPSLNDPSPAAVDWSGPSFATFGESLFSNADVSASGAGQFNGFGLRGPGVGFSAGYDIETGSGLVTGVAGDLKFSTSSATLSGGGAQAEVMDRAAWSLRGRVGEAVGNSTLLYATAGFSEMLASATASGLAGAGGYQTAYLPGLVLGVGAETRLSGDIFTRLELLHSIYAKSSFFGGALSAQPSTDALRLSLVWRPDTTTRRSGASSAAAAPTDWTGGYVAGMAGWNSNAFALGGPAGGRFSGLAAVGPTGALIAGYNAQIRNVVAGAEVEAGGAAAAAKMTSTGGQVLQGSVGAEAALRLRFGALLGPGTMLYESAGLTMMDTNWSGSSGPFTVAGSKAFSGAQLGLGLETMITPNVAARVEYLYSVYAPQSDVSPRAGVSRTGLVYKF